MAVSTEAHHVTGQVFSGRFVAGDGDVAPASFAVDSDQVVITGPEGKSHRWSVHEIVVTAVSSPRFQFDIAGEKAVFEADSPSRFLFEFLPSLRNARQRYAPPAATQEAAPGTVGGYVGGAPVAPAIETAPAAVETLVTEPQAAAEDETAIPPVETEADEVDLVIDLRPRERSQPQPPTPARSLSDTIRRHKEQAANRADAPPPADAPAPSRAEDSSAASPSTVENVAESPAPRPEVQLREPWDTITPKLASRAASVEAPSAEAPDVPTPKDAQSPAPGPAETANDDPDETDGPSGADLSEPGQGGEPAPTPTTPAPGEEAAIPDLPPGRPRLGRPGQAARRTGLGELVKAARGDQPESPSVTTGDLSDLRAGDHGASITSAGSSTVLDELRRRWRSLRRDRPDPTSEPERVSPEPAPEPESSPDLTEGTDVTADPAMDNAGAPNSGPSADAASSAVGRVAPEHATPGSPSAGPPRIRESENAAEASAHEAGACVHEWDSSLPPGAVTRICLRCKAVEAIPAEPPPPAPPADVGSERQPDATDDEPGGGSRPSARSELLRQAAARRRAYRNRWSG